MAGVWSDLPADLINKIGDYFLRSNDLDYYSSLRAVCLNWRVATEPPNFFLNNWIMLEKSSDQKVSFLNLLTGRVCEKCIPNDLLRKYYFVGATTGGLVVLGKRVSPYKMRLLNPFTGSIFRFAVQIPSETLSSVAVVDVPCIVFISNLQNSSVRWADQNTEEGQSATGFGEGEFSSIEWFGQVSSMTAHDGEVFVVDNHGAIISTVHKFGTSAIPVARTARTVKMARTIDGPNFPGMSYNNRFYLVQNDVDLLLVISGHVEAGNPVVYRVNTDKLVISIFALELSLHSSQVQSAADSTMDKCSMG